MVCFLTTMASKKKKEQHPAVIEYLRQKNAPGGTARMAKLTSEEMEALSSSGGKARAEALSKKRRSEIAKAAAEARWGKKKKT